MEILAADRFESLHDIHQIQQLDKGKAWKCSKQALIVKKMKIYEDKSEKPK